MGETIFETVDTMLESVQDEVDDSEVSFKLRTARQLIVLLDQQHSAGQEVLKDADLDRETVENLRLLGYFE